MSDQSKSERESGISEGVVGPSSGLAHLQFGTDTVPNPGGDFTVRGLSLADFQFVYAAIGDQLRGMFSGVKFDTSGVTTAETRAIADAQFGKTLPVLAAHVIARAADEPDVNLATKLTWPVQIDAMNRVAALTFPAGGDHTKLVDVFVQMAREYSVQSPQLTGLKDAIGRPRSVH